MPSEWTPDTLFLHFSAIREADQAALKAALAQSDHRLDSVNEWRGTVQDLISRTLTRAEAWTFLIGVIGAIGSITIVWSLLNK